MPAVNLSPVGGAAAQFFTNTGNVLTGGKLYTYLSGTTTPTATYTTSAGNVARTNPVVLDAAGRVPGSGEIWLALGVNYKFLLTDSNDVLIGTYDNIPSQATTDASLVTYTAAGAGAVTTTVQAKLREWLTVSDFGANNQTAIDAVFVAAQAQGKSVIFTSGEYTMSVGVSIPDYVDVMCMPGVRIQYTGTGFFAFSIGKGCNFFGNGVLIDCTNALWNGGAIMVDGVHRFADDYPVALDGINVQGVTNTKGTGLYLTATDATDFISFVRFSNFTFHRLNFGLTADAGSSGTAGDVNTWHWINGNVFENFNYYGTNFGINLNGLDNVPAEVNGNMFNNHIFQVSSTAISLNGASGNTFSNIFVFDWNYSSGDAIIFTGGANANIVFSNIRNEGITGGSTNYCQTPIGEFTAARTFKSNVDIEGYCAVDGAVTSGGNLWVQDLSEIRLGYTGFFSTIKNDTGAGPLTLTPTTGYNITMNGETNFVGKIGPSSDNLYSNGFAGRRWTEVFAANGTINTSDENEKQDIEPIGDAVLRAWSKVEFYQFKFKDAVEKKGDAARTHIGLMAQRIKAAFESEGLDPFAYGLLCFDQWDDQFEDVVVAEKYIDENGGECTRGIKTGEKRLVLAAGARYGIRYEQALALECAYLRSKITGV